jgi:hypothetical protein
MNRHHRRAASAQARQLRLQQMQALIKQVCDNAKEINKPARLMITMTPLLEAILDPRIGAGVVAYVEKVADDLDADIHEMQCFGCCRPWEPSHHLAAIALIEFIDLPAGPQGALVAGLCADCCSQRPPRLRRRPCHAAGRDRHGVNISPAIPENIMDAVNDPSILTLD